MVHLLDEEDSFDSSCPAGHIVTLCTWQMTQGLYDDVASFILSSEPLEMVYKQLQFVWRPRGHLCAPTHTWEHHRCYLNKLRFLIFLENVDS